MNRTRSGGLAAIIATGFLLFSAGPAVATGDQPGCHGDNQEDCRPDPNEHGQDCDEHGRHDESNDDHCGTTTSSTTTTTTLLDLMSTTTVTVAPTTTTTAAPTTTTTAAVVVAPQPAAPAADVLSTTETLPRTGFPIAFYTAIGLLCLFLGVGGLYVRRIESTKT